MQDISGSQSGSRRSPSPPPRVRRERRQGGRAPSKAPRADARHPQRRRRGLRALRRRRRAVVRGSLRIRVPGDWRGDRNAQRDRLRARDRLRRPHGKVPLGIVGVRRRTRSASQLPGPRRPVPDRQPRARGGRAREAPRGPRARERPRGRRRRGRAPSGSACGARLGSPARSPAPATIAARDRDPAERHAEETFRVLGAPPTGYIPVDFAGFDGTDPDPLTITRESFDHEHAGADCQRRLSGRRPGRSSMNRSVRPAHARSSKLLAAGRRRPTRARARSRDQLSARDPLQDRPLPAPHGDGGRPGGAAESRTARLRPDRARPAQ